MEILIFYSLVAAIIAGLLTLAIQAFTHGISDGIRDGLIATVITFVVEMAFLYFIMPPFAHWTDWGYSLTGGIIALITCLVLFVTDTVVNHTSSLPATMKALAVSFLAWVIFFVAELFVPPFPLDWADNATYDEIANLIQVRPATQADLQAQATDDDLVKMSPAAAKLEAQSEMPEEYGTFTKVNNSHEQVVNGQAVYVTDLAVTNWPAYRNQGATLPGFMIRPARTTDSATTFVAGHQLRYVPDAQLQLDLDRHVYLNYTLGCGCTVDSLDVLEIDDQGKPWYTGTVWRLRIGNEGSVAEGVIVVNPTTGEITEYPINAVPAWIDRIYSLEVMTNRVQRWATYSSWDSTFPFQTTAGKKTIDAGEDVYGANAELYYSFTISSVGSDQTIIHEIRVNPRTGEAILFEADGITIAAVKNVIAERTSEINAQHGAVPIECERQPLLGVMSYYCLLQASDNSESIQGSIVGYAFYNPISKFVVVNRDFNAAWTAFRRDLRTSGNEVQVQGEAANAITYEGIIKRKGDRAIDGMVLILVSNNTYTQGIYFQVPEDNPVLSVTQQWDRVQIIAYDLRVDGVNDVEQLVNLSLTPLE